MRKVLLLFFIFFIVLLLYNPVLTTYYSQDHFLHFKVSQTDGSFSQFLNLFTFHSFEERGLAYYRPLFRDVLFHNLYNLFGLNHLPYRIFYFLIHFINITLVFILFQKLFKKTALSVFVSFFFAISAANIGILYWGIEIMGATMFIYSTMILFISFLETQRYKFLVFSFVTFLLALGSHELSVMTPILLFGLVLVFQQFKSISKYFLPLLPFLLIVIPYAYLDITTTGYSSSDLQYHPHFNLKTTLNTLIWYSAWSLGIPEMFVDFVYPGLKLNPSLMQYWGNYFQIIFLTLAVIVIALGVLIIYLFSLKNKKILSKKFIFLILWFPISLAPVLLMPLHKFTYFLSPALAAFWGIIGCIILISFEYFRKKLPKLSIVFLLVIIFMLISLNLTSILLGHSTYWASQRGKIAKKLINQATSAFTTLPKGSIIYFTNDPSYPYIAKDWGGTSKQASIILSGSDALQLIYKDPSLTVYYEDLGGLPKDIPSYKIYKIEAKIH